jgi:hypothetical protein
MADPRPRKEERELRKSSLSFFAVQRCASPFLAQPPLRTLAPPSLRLFFYLAPTGAVQLCGGLQKKHVYKEEEEEEEGVR